MSYQVIARKWRPQTFEEVTGQEAITRTLRNAVESERLHHAYLFSGARGVGKTTTARLLAKALNCHKTDKPTPQPCSINDPAACASCREIAEGRSIDVLEFDAASNTQVDKIRDLIIENINIAPARDRYKIFIIDEVHMLSTSSFNALLKTLEEPPPRVTFVMATTELHKVPDTILSRCQEFEFRTIPLQKIFDRLKIIADAEEIKIEEKALREIARSGEGSMRDAQSNFDQVISFSGEQIGTEDVMNALGTASAEMLLRVVGAIAENKPAEALKVVDDLIVRGQDLRNFCRDLLSFFRDLMVMKVARDAENLLDTAILSQEEMNRSAAPFSDSDLIRFFNSLSETESKLREATQPRYVLEIGLVKLIEMRRVAPIEKILERLADLENALANGNFQSEAKGDFEPQIKQEPTVEKKKLTPDFPLDEVPFPVKSAIAVETPANGNGHTPTARVEIKETLPPFEPDFAPEERFAPEENFAAFDPPKTDFSALADTRVSVSDKKSNGNGFSSFLDIESLPVRLPPILSEELEHVEESWLDARYEVILRQAGDDLAPLKSASKIVKTLLGDSVNSETAKIESSNGTAPAKEKPVFTIPILQTEEISDEIPELPENPTDEDLWRFAENHPLTKKVLKIFRGKILEVKRV